VPLEPAHLQLEIADRSESILQFLDPSIDGAQPFLPEQLHRGAKPPAGDAEVVHRFFVESAERALFRRADVR
jgi:hypothetical protein